MDDGVDVVGLGILDIRGVDVDVALVLGVGHGGSGILGLLRGVGGVILGAAGDQGEHHGKSQEQCDQFFHCRVPPYFSFRARRT